MATTKRRIEAKANNDRKIELIAGEAGIYPGMLCSVNASGQAIKNASSGGALGDENLVALEDGLQGGKGVDTVYPSGQRVFLAIAKAGSEYNVLVADEQRYSDRMTNPLVSIANTRNPAFTNLIMFSTPLAFPRS